MPKQAPLVRVDGAQNSQVGLTVQDLQVCMFESGMRGLGFRAYLVKTHNSLNVLIQVPMKTYCFADEESFVPDHFAYVLEHVPLDSG